MDEKKLREVIRNIIKEMSVSGGGVAGATYIPGEGMQTTTPVAGKDRKSVV